MVGILVTGDNHFIVHADDRDGRRSAPYATGQQQRLLLRQRNQLVRLGTGLEACRRAPLCETAH